MGHLSLEPGDRFLLYTDGLLEAQNAKGEYFGDRKVDEILVASESLSQEKLGSALLSELGCWQPVPSAQQDDVTCLILDIV